MAVTISQKPRVFAHLRQVRCHHATLVMRMVTWGPLSRPGLVQKSVLAAAFEAAEQGYGTSTVASAVKSMKQTIRLVQTSRVTASKRRRPAPVATC
jgi:hypothetical protein